MTFEQWVQANAPHVWKHRDGPFVSTYDAYRRCWDAAVRSIAPANFVPGTALCLKCGATYDKGLAACPLCPPPSHCHGQEKP